MGNIEIRVYLRKTQCIYNGNWSYSYKNGKHTTNQNMFSFIIHSAELNQLSLYLNLSEIEKIEINPIIKTS